MSSPFPEQFFATNRGAGGAAIGITLPVPEALISYVIDSIVFACMNQSAATVAMAITVKDSNGTNYLNPGIDVIAAAGSRDSASIDGPIVIAPGFGVTVVFNGAPPASVTQELIVQGHVI